VTDTVEAIEDVTPRHVDGHAYVKMGKRGAITDLIAVVDVEANGETWDYETLLPLWLALKGTLQTVTTHEDEPQTNVMILDVKPEYRRPLTGAVQGITDTPAELVTIRFRAQATEVV